MSEELKKTTTAFTTLKKNLNTAGTQLTSAINNYAQLRQLAYTAGDAVVEACQEQKAKGAEGSKPEDFAAKEVKQAIADLKEARKDCEEARKRRNALGTTLRIGVTELATMHEKLKASITQREKKKTSESLPELKKLAEEIEKYADKIVEDFGADYDSKPFKSDIEKWDEQDREIVSEIKKSKQEIDAKTNAGVAAQALNLRILKTRLNQAQTLCGTLGSHVKAVTNYLKVGDTEAAIESGKEAEKQHKALTTFVSKYFEVVDKLDKNTLTDLEYSKDGPSIKKMLEEMKTSQTNGDKLIQFVRKALPN